ncbi:MAG: hypothetical protein K0R39_1684 [Symbiobacteriaceae bacterium]|nr:hypothetical protein [Symbiobacteriaceae bacterium]
MQDRFYGVYPALVTANADEKHPGLLEVALPWCPDVDGEPVRAWARLATAMAGNGRGHWFIPDVDDEVLVCFEGGDPSRPYIMGALWNGKDKAPETMAEENNVKSITTRSGIKLTFDDTEDAVKVLLTTPGGHELLLEWHQDHRCQRPHCDDGVRWSDLET